MDRSNSDLTKGSRHDPINFMKKSNKHIAVLNARENHAWEFAFCFHLDAGKTNLQADKLAWRDLRLEFPRLLQFDGCR